MHDVNITFYIKNISALIHKEMIFIIHKYIAKKSILIIMCFIIYMVYKM